jgi:hypothetical protein
MNQALYAHMNNKRKKNYIKKKKNSCKETEKGARQVLRFHKAQHQKYDQTNIKINQIS